jgi:hypothetical protein
MSKDRVISVRVDEDIYTELLGFSEELGISLSNCASVCLRLYLESQREEDDEEDE